MSATRPPAEPVPAAGEGRECDDPAAPAPEAREDRAESPRPQKCRVCEKKAVRLSLFCQDHQEEIVRAGKKTRLRRLDVVLLLLLIALVLLQPEVRSPVWVTNDDAPGVWESIRDLFSRLTGREGAAPALPASESGSVGPQATAPQAAAPGVGQAEAPAVCGNGVVESGELCDGSALNGASCASLGFAGDCGSDPSCVHAGLACLGSCRFDYSGCTAESQAALQRFVDNGNDTATDRLTGLVWELKCAAEDCREQHDVVAKLPWQAAATAWVKTLNDTRFAGYDDWRLPSLEELRTLLAAVPPCATPPCRVAAWPRGETAPAGYWSSTSFSLDRQRAWAVSFGDGEAFTAEKDAALYVRAVRSGS